MMSLLEDVTGLSPLQKNSILVRYISLTETFTRRTKMYAIGFHVGRTIVTVGSLIVPALLSIQYNGTFAVQIYWITWFVSLLVTTCNGILTLFKIDKKYYFLHTTLGQLKSEAWQYLYLSGKYSGFYTKGKAATHANQYVFFCHNMEKIKLKQVEEEYYKLVDHPTGNQSTHSEKGVGGATVDLSGNDPQTKMIAGLYHPTPSTDELLRHQQDLARALVKEGDKVDGSHPETTTTGGTPGGTAPSLPMRQLPTARRKGPNLL